MTSQALSEFVDGESPAPEDIYAAAFETAPSGMFILDAGGCILDVNIKALEIFGYEKDEVVGGPLSLVLPDRYRKKYFHRADGLLQSLLCHPLVGSGRTFIGVRKDGSEIPLGVSLSLSRLRDQIRIVGVIANISQRRQMLADYRNLNRRFKHLLNSSATILYVVDLETHQQTYISENFSRLLGYGTGKILDDQSFWYQHLHPDDRRQVLSEYFRQLDNGEGSLEYRFRHEDGCYHWIFDSFRVTRHCAGKPVEVMGSWTDISTRKVVEEERDRMKSELCLAHKLEAVGQLASGIAHEINTPIQFVGDSVHFLKTAYEDLQILIDHYRASITNFKDAPLYQTTLAKLQESEEDTDLEYLKEEVPEALERTFDGIERVTNIVRAMKEFGHADQREKTPADLNRAIQTTLAVARNEYKYVAEIETEFSEIPMVECLIGDINQVFLNLIVNAAHAISDRVKNGGMGRITIRTHQEGEEIVIVEIQDTGSGIPEKITNRIFDPFFTTKEVGRGTGQGLAIARAIVVDKHGGSLTFDSKPEEGTTFFIRLPIHAAHSKMT